MPHRNSDFQGHSPYFLVGAIALTIHLSAQAETATGTQPKESGSTSEPSQSSFPVRSRGYIDDYAELNATREGVVVLPSGVQYEVLREGSGKRPRANDSVKVHYKAMLATGVEFDNTYEQGEPASFQLDQYLVPGLKEALLLMKEGDEWRVTIPAKMGFHGGRFLRKRDLIYEITLISVMNTPGESKKGRHTSEIDQ